MLGVATKGTHYVYLAHAAYSEGATEDKAPEAWRGKRQPEGATQGEEVAANTRRHALTSFPYPEGTSRCNVARLLKEKFVGSPPSLLNSTSSGRKLLSSPITSQQLTASS
jgi:hypothetical protein